jgi:ferritin-like metal-binding protein YciE
MATKAPDKDSTANAKLVQYLTEALGKERELETALPAHIEIASRPAYKKRLQQHLKETKQHGKLVERRLKKLGGGGATAKLTEAASRGLATAKGPLHAIRGTGPEEKQLKNAKTEFSEEHEEIATYLAIETLAEAVGDTETAKLAKGIRREEERMASFLEKQIPLLTKDVAKAEIPAAERNGGRSSRSKPRSRTGTSSKPAAKRARASSKAKPAAKRATRKRSSSTRRKAAARS